MSVMFLSPHINTESTNEFITKCIHYLEHFLSDAFRIYQKGAFLFTLRKKNPALLPECS